MRVIAPDLTGGKSSSFVSGAGWLVFMVSSIYFIPLVQSLKKIKQKLYHQHNNIQSTRWEGGGGGGGVGVRCVCVWGGGGGGGLWWWFQKKKKKVYTVEPQWLEHLWDHGNLLGRLSPLNS